MKKPIIVAVVGPTCCGKTTECDKLKKAFGSDCKVLSQDNFYNSADEFTNFDIPPAIDFKRLIETVKDLKEGKSVQIPQYDFKTHQRSKETVLFEPVPIIIIEGILLFCNDELLKLFDIKVYIQSDRDETKKRRLIRDVRDRGRTEESVERQYINHVIPSNKQYIEPSKRHADITLIDNSDFTFQGEAELLTAIRKKIGFILE